jgi:hypothetical protein
MGLHNALKHGCPSAGTREEQRANLLRLLAAAGIALADDEFEDLAARAAGSKVHTVARRKLDRSTGDLYPSEDGRWYALFSDEDGTGGHPVYAGRY